MIRMEIETQRGPALADQEVQSAPLDCATIEVRMCALLYRRCLGESLVC